MSPTDPNPRHLFMGDRDRELDEKKHGPKLCVRLCLHMDMNIEGVPSTTLFSSLNCWMSASYMDRLGVTQGSWQKSPEAERSQVSLWQNMGIAHNRFSLLTADNQLNAPEYFPRDSLDVPDLQKYIPRRSYLDVILQIPSRHYNIHPGTVSLNTFVLYFAHQCCWCIKSSDAVA